jgi:pyocin large subunit-like protein
VTADEYATALALASTLVIAAVHRGSDSAPFVQAALALTPPTGADRYGALLNIISAQVDPNTSLTERLAWTNPQVLAAVRGAA